MYSKTPGSDHSIARDGGEDELPWYETSLASKTQLPTHISSPVLPRAVPSQSPYQPLSPRPIPALSSTNPFYRHFSTSTLEQVDASNPSDTPVSSLRISGRAPLERLDSLGDYFPTGESVKTSYTDGELVEIARLLNETKRETWSKMPRIYTVLRLIGQLSAIESFLDEGLNDLWLPFTVTQLPHSMSAFHREQFIDNQHIVLTKAIDLENNAEKRHIHFKKGEDVPLKIQGRLGKGGYGWVYEAYSPLSGRTYALKIFQRMKTHKSEVQSFMTELQVLKRINHHHCVELVASYTDPKNFGLIISPVAECNLKEFYATVATDRANEGTLRAFFGCLAHALSFLHDNKVRHRDIKPENILVKASHVYLADFGISWDWQNLSRSTTTDDSAKTLIYCAPEVAENGSRRRNSSSDIWSLGCVYIEMLTVLNGFTVSDLRDEMRKYSGRTRFYENVDLVLDWTQRLTAHGVEADKEVIRWIRGMVVVDPDKRLSARSISEMTTVSMKGVEEEAKRLFCGECCLAETGEEPSAEELSDADVWEAIAGHDSTTSATSPPVTEKSRRFNGFAPSSLLSSRASLPAAGTFADIENARSAEISDCTPGISDITDATAHKKQEEQEQEAFVTVRNPYDSALARVLDESSRTESEPKDERARTTKIRQDLIHIVTSKYPVWPFIIISHRLPTLTPASWLSPEEFLESVRSDVPFIEYVRSIDKSQVNRFNDATVNDVLPILHLLLLNGLDINDEKFRNDEQQGAMPLFMTLGDGWASIPGKEDVPQLLIGFGASLNATTSNKSRETPIFKACDMGYIHVLKVLLALDKTLLGWTSGEHGFTLLHMAAYYGQDQIAKFLINLGMEVQATDFYGHTPAAHAADLGHLGVLKTLIKNGPGVEGEKATPRGWQLIHYAAKSGHIDMIEYLISRGANIRSVAKDGSTPGTIAAKYGHVSVIEVLVRRGLRVDEKMPRGESVNNQMIHSAAISGQTEVVKYLIEQGADIRIRSDPRWGTPGQHAVKNRHLSVLQVLVQSGLLVEERSPHDRYEELRLIHAAAWGGNIEIVQYLIAQGADPTREASKTFGFRSSSSPLGFAKNGKRLENMDEQTYKKLKVVLQNAVTEWKAKK